MRVETSRLINGQQTSRPKRHPKTLSAASQYIWGLYPFLHGRFVSLTTGVAPIDLDVSPNVSPKCIFLYTHTYICVQTYSLLYIFTYPFFKEICINIYIYRERREMKSEKRLDGILLVTTLSTLHQCVR